MTPAKSAKPIDLYLRISNDPDNNEEGVRRQEKLVNQLLKSRGLTAGKTIVDNDVSAHSGVKRPGFAEVCERMANGTSGGVAAYHWKRLLRRPREMEDFIDLVEGSQAVVLTVASGDVDLTSAAGRAVARIFGSLGAMESEETSERMKARFAQEADAGMPHRRGTRPFGYNDDWQTIHPVEGPAYRELFERVARGFSLGMIAREWERQGILNRKGVRFSVSSLQRLVTAPRAIGVRVHQGQEVGDGDWEPIVSREVQEAAKAALRSRQTHLRGTTSRRPARLLSSMLVCGECGSPLRVQKQGQYMVYCCYAANSGGACGKVSISAIPAEDEVTKRLLGRLMDPKTQRALKKLREERPNTSRLVAEMERLQLDIDAAAADLGSGLISRKVWKQIHEGTTARLDAARSELAKSVDNPELLGTAPEDTVRLWDTLPLDVQRQRLAAFVQCVNVESLGGRGGRPFRPERIHIDWRV